MTRLVLPALLASACATADPIFDDVGFVHPEYGYHIEFANEPRRVLITSEWRVENYARQSEEWIRREAAQYWHAPLLDLDGDGILETLEREYLYDLRMRHVRSNGLIWVRTVPLELDLQEVELDVLARNYVENIASSGFLLARVAPGVVAVGERRFASRVLDQLPIRVDGYEAYGVLLEVASVAQLQLSEASRIENAVIVLSRAPFGWREWSSEGYRDWPVIVIAGYSNSPAEFEQGLPDFDTLLAAIDLDGTRDPE